MEVTQWEQGMSGITKPATLMRNRILEESCRQAVSEKKTDGSASAHFNPV